MSEQLADSQVQEGLPLKKYISILFHYRFLILSVFILGSALGVACAFLFVPEKEVYDGYKKIVLRNPDTELGFITGNTNLGHEGSFFLEAEINRMRDQSILEQVVRDCNLNQQALKFNERFMKTPRGHMYKWIRDHFSFLLGDKESLPEDQRFFKNAVEDLQKDLVIEPVEDKRNRGRNTQGVILSVNYSNEDPEMVKNVIDTFVSENRRQRKASYTGSSLLQKQKQLYIKQLNDLEIKLNEIKSKLQDKYKELDLPFNSDPSFLLATETQHTLQMRGRLTQIEGENERAKIQIAQYQKELDSVPPVIQSNSTDVVDISPRAREIRLSITSLEEKRNNIKSRLLDSTLAEFQRKVLGDTLEKYNKELKEMNKEFADLSKTKEISSPEAIRIKSALNHEKITYDFLSKEKKNLTDRLSAQLENELKLRSKIADLTVSRDEFNKINLQYEEQKRAVENFNIYEFARKDVDVLKDVNTKVILSNEPRAAHKVTRMKVIIGVIFGSLAAGLALAFMFGMVLDSSFHRPVETETILNVPVIACVPESRRRLLK